MISGGPFLSRPLSFTADLQESQYLGQSEDYFVQFILFFLPFPYVLGHAPGVLLSKSSRTQPQKEASTEATRPSYKGHRGSSLRGLLNLRHGFGHGSPGGHLNRRRTNVQQLTCKIDLSNSFYYLFFSFVLLELIKGKVLGEKL